jgi:hypothetical protein
MLPVAPPTPQERVRTLIPMHVAEAPHNPRKLESLSLSGLALTVQLVVGWAGEAGENPRLGWWNTDLASEFGGEDLFRRLLPNSWRWDLPGRHRELGTGAEAYVAEVRSLLLEDVRGGTRVRLR